MTEILKCVQPINFGYEPSNTFNFGDSLVGEATEEDIEINEICDNDQNTKEVSEDEFLDGIGVINFDVNDLIFVEEEKDCTHPTIDENGVCKICFIECKVVSEENETRFYKENDSKTTVDPSRCTIQTKKDKGIKGDLEKYQFSPIIVQIANDKYLKATKGKTLRANCRKGMMFASVLDAHETVGEKSITKDIMERMNIKRKVASKGVKEYSLSKPKTIEDSTPTYITVDDYIPRIMKKYNSMDNHISALLELNKKVKNRSTQIKRANAQSVACALIFYYSNILGKNLKCKHFATSVGISEITIIKLNKEIISIINKIDGAKE